MFASRVQLDSHYADLVYVWEEMGVLLQDGVQTAAFFQCQREAPSSKPTRFVWSSTDLIDANMSADAPRLDADGRCQEHAASLSRRWGWGRLCSWPWREPFEGPAVGGREC